MKHRFARDTMTYDTFEDIDAHFARFIGEMAGSDAPDLIIAAALVSRATRNGNVCLYLKHYAGQTVHLADLLNSPFTCPKFDIWYQTLLRQPVVGYPGQYCPLILDDAGRLYLYRYWAYEKDLAQGLLARAGGEDPVVDYVRLQASLQRHYPYAPDQTNDAQRIASALAVLKRLCIVVGGPGTGKTTAIARTLAIMQEQNPHEAMRIMMAAPTGKAAVQLQDTLQRIKPRLNVDPNIRKMIPEEVTTIHRLLKPIAGSPFFKHDQHNPIQTDALVVDEASMVDLPLMYKLLQALPNSARLLLVGDKNQLASVETGAVLGDICNADRMEGFSAPFEQVLINVGATEPEKSLAANSGLHTLADHIVVLHHPYRFKPESGIGRLSQAVNQGRVSETLQLLRSEAYSDIGWESEMKREPLLARLVQFVIQGYRDYLTCKDPQQALERMHSFKVLCAVNHGPWGVEAVNRMASERLSLEGLISLRTSSPWYAGRPVMITRNDHRLGLFNGDMGLTWRNRRNGDSTYAVYFKSPRGGYRRFAPHQLPPHQTVYATTVHKSQGSEFDHVVLVLPKPDQKVLSRELIYTAITRARRRFVVLGSSEAIEKAVERPIARTSGLQGLLWAPTTENASTSGQDVK